MRGENVPDEQKAPEPDDVEEVEAPGEGLDPEPEPCNRCGMSGLHVCLPAVLDMMEGSPMFMDRLSRLVLDKLREGQPDGQQQR